MHVISRPKLREFAKRHADARSWIESWWRVATSARWENLADVRRVFLSADQVGRCLVFNACGNNYRLIVRVSYADQYQRGMLLVKHFLPHTEYDRNQWKGDC